MTGKGKGSILDRGHSMCKGLDAARTREPSTKWRGNRKLRTKRKKGGFKDGVL